MRIKAHCASVGKVSSEGSVLCTAMSDGGREGDEMGGPGSGAHLEVMKSGFR